MLKPQIRIAAKSPKKIFFFMSFKSLIGIANIVFFDFVDQPGLEPGTSRL